MCTWEPRCNLVITTTFERRASARLSSWLKKIWDSVERLDWMLSHVFDELGLYWNTDKFKTISEQAQTARGSLRVARCTPKVQRPKNNWDTLLLNRRLSRRLISGKKKMSNVWVEERAERTFYVAENLDSSVEMTLELSTQIWKEKVVGGTHKGRCYGLGSQNDVRLLQSGLEGLDRHVKPRHLIVFRLLLCRLKDHNLHWQWQSSSREE
ncbi:hypothetical protein H5410_026810 [Solanum commersonii]|uniref:Uncharacterized protein n=1 Tax=Solanum commersonii TaxID=4109 RepID=A0A9J5Z2L5_SOLCO|nr:hypothetical protein H5410_026810 [Solanum commersonii]